MQQSAVGVPVKVSVFMELVDFLREKGSDRDPASAVETAIEYWISNASWKTKDLMPELYEKPKHLGYLWKNLRMPPGTKIRMKYKGNTHHAEIIGDSFCSDGRPISPSEFANSVAGGTSRNAWRDLLIQRPHDPQFRLADELRQEELRQGQRRNNGVDLDSLLNDL